jgi:Heterokaryon incompatibility protein (HET)
MCRINNSKGTVTDSHDGESVEHQVPVSARQSLSSAPPSFTVEYKSDHESSRSIRRPLHSLPSIRSIQSSLGSVHQPLGVTEASSYESPRVDSPEGSSPSSYMVRRVKSDGLDLGYLDEIEQRGDSCKFCKLVADSARITMTDSQTDPRQLSQKEVKGPEYRNKCILEKRHLCTVYTGERVGVGSRVSPRNFVINRLQLRLSPFEPMFFGIQLQPCFFPIPSTEECWRQSSHGNELARIKGSGRHAPQVADTMLFKKWIEQCETLHDDRCACPVWLQDASVPLDLKVIDVNDMCITDALPDCRYLALSYVWGDAVSRGGVQTTRENNASRRIRGGLNGNFPPAIKDALELVRSLGERYLWVDAICINQDDDMEKAGFISQMDKIFAGALLTIIAAGSTAAHGLPGIAPGSREISQPYVRVGDKLAIMRCLTLHEQHRLQDSEWNQRGWTFQERYVSRRCLIFTEKQVYWKCQMGIWNEENVFEPPRPRHWAMGRSFACCDQYEEDEVFTKDSMANLVSQYSTRKFTFPRDALDGLAGILHGMQLNTGELFYWGLPVSRFDQDLVWYGGGKRIKDSRRIIYPDRTVAEVPFPSWTWASYQGSGCHMYPANERREKRSRAGKSGSELKFYKVSDDGRVAPLDGVLVFDSGSLPAGEVDPFEALRKEWKGSCHIPEDSFTQAHPFRDSGRLIFWTSYARLCLRRSDSAIIAGDGMEVGTLKSISSSISFSDVDLHDFIVISRVARIGSALETKKLNVMLVRWHRDEPVVCSRVAIGTVEEARWITVDREWRKVILA